jgi:hypothetical protein
MKSEELGSLLEAESRKADEGLLREIAVSMASFIVKIDASSNDVASYIEQRLAPLVPLLRIDVRVQDAIKRIATDDRHYIADAGR